MTPGEAIRKYCLECVGDSQAILDCGGDEMLGSQGDENNHCFFFPFRFGDKKVSEKIIHKFCLECQGSSFSKKRYPQTIKDAVLACEQLNCPLWTFRMGSDSF